MTVCNHQTGTPAIRAGALCFVINPNVGNGGDRLKIRGRSRGGRWIEKWERADRLGNFRNKNKP